MPGLDVSGAKRRSGSKTPFEIKVDENASPPLVALKGDVDVAVIEKLHEHLNELIESGVDRLDIDCANVTYVDSTGLSELLWAVKRTKVRLVNCAPRLIKLLQVTGLESAFEVVLPGAS